MATNKSKAKPSAPKPARRVRHPETKALISREMRDQLFEKVGTAWVRRADDAAQPPKQPPAPKALPKQPPAPKALPKQPPAPKALPKQPPAPKALPKQPPAPKALPKQPPAPKALPKQPPAPKALPKPTASTALPKAPEGFATPPVPSRPNVPVAYGVDHVATLSKGPNKVFIYWEMTGDGVARARANLAHDHHAELTLRVYVVRTNHSPETFDVPITDWVGSHNLALSYAATQVVAAVGYKGESGTFAHIAESRPTRMPRTGAGQERVVFTKVTPASPSATTPSSTAPGSTAPGFTVSLTTHEPKVDTPALYASLPDHTPTFHEDGAAPTLVTGGSEIRLGGGSGAGR